MSFRVADSTTSATLSARIGQQRERLAVLQERLTSGKRINRPSDDPAGAAAVLNLRNSQTELTQFRRTAQTLDAKLSISDSLVQDYQNKLDQTRAFLSQGASDHYSQDARNVLATQLDGLKQQILAVANSTSSDEYIFGGTRQTAPPYDAVTAVPALPVATQQFIQAEPNTPAVATGVTAETLFADGTGTIFAALTDAAAALRGTGDPVADQATIRTVLGRMDGFLAQAGSAQASIGAGQNLVQATSARMDAHILALDTDAHNIEDADFADSALRLTDAQRALDATLQSGAYNGRRTLLDFLG